MSTAVDEPVEIRAFRGTRQASVYQELVLRESSFVRIVLAAGRQRLRTLGSLDQHGTHELDKAQAQGVAEEVTQLRSSGELIDVDDDLTALAELSRWCAHAREDAWLKIQGP
ncbi:MAG TPA: hypothetical protein VI142_10265 [Gaiellaceae bacterium]